MAGLRGVEPPTTWFVARCSIQLSYRPAETTHAFPLDYDTLPATSTAPGKSNSRARLQIPAPLVACRKFFARLHHARKIHGALDVLNCSPRCHAPVTITR